MNKVTTKNCSLKETSAVTCGNHDVLTTVDCTKELTKTTRSVKNSTNLNGLVNGVNEEKSGTLKKVNNKREKKNVKQTTNCKNNSTTKEDSTKIKVVNDNCIDKQIVDSTINIKNNRKSNKGKNSKTNLNNTDHIKKNNLNVPNDNVLKKQQITPKENIKEHNNIKDVPKTINNQQQTCKKNKQKSDTTINKEEHNLGLVDDFDITSIITNKKTELIGKQINEPTCSKNLIDDIVNEATDLVEKLNLNVENENRNEEEINKNEENLPPIEYVQYESELQMPMIMKIIQKDLSEPYSIYTYRYFIHNWPNLCFLAMCEGLCVGAIVCKLDVHRKVIKRGYIAMLAVDKNYRNRGIGSTLVRRAIQEMITGDADEVVLETEITNKPALRLYEALGFVRDKRLFRYYLNGVDALRLKLWLR